MCPPAPVPPPADIGLCWTDEELFMSLHKIMRGSPLPGNVLADVNPYHYMPSNLPDGFWFFVRLEEKKDMELGFWKAKGEACEIFTNSAIIGWRTTLEFYEVQPHVRRTDWMMQEYKITPKGLCDDSKPKDPRSLCRVFRCDGRSRNQEMLPKHGGADITGGNGFNLIPSTVPNTGSASGQGSTSESQEKNRGYATRSLAVAERLPDPPVENLHEFDYILGGDYLELDDLADPASPSSSSDSSSCLSLTSDECFDSLALLRDLEDENRDPEGNDANFKFNVSASVKPNEVVVPPATLGSLIGGNESKSALERILESDYSLLGSAIDGKSLDKRVLGDAIKSQKAVQMNEGTSKPRNVAVSSGSHKAGSEGGKKAIVGRNKKLMKKYLCFMPF